jgi:hypothetical protein
MPNRGVLVGALIAGAVAACGGAPKEAQDATSVAPPVVEKPWADKSREERLDWMGLEVFPKMKAAFSEFDSEGYAEFACQTCHGDDMESVDFKLPNSLYALPKTGTFDKAMEYDAETTQFMAKVVVPEMAKLLGMEPYNPETQSGFGCFACHPSEDD